ncbi:nitrite reductase [Photobacterium sp. SDRW27]|uniref:TPR domain-containing protein n=1 Tax=Photobacterium obscurum TaxID=2829490 RepID=UPI002242F3DB|nr:nitrite reductase [Photobacterium obscurum]MCW8331196.1 nitrite reductase [Photobacterium obscurum]
MLGLRTIMQVFVLELGIAFFVLLVVGFCILWRFDTRNGVQKRNRTSALLGLIIAAISAGAYLFLGEPDFQSKQRVEVEAEAVELAALSAQELNQKRIVEIQNQLRSDKQNGELWYALGNAYMYTSEYENAALAFSYSARLADEPQANIFSAQATALYYRDGQRLNSESEHLLSQALALDEDNLPALMLLASDYFLNARYQKAIDVWQQALDSEHPDLNRVELITAINRAKQLL